MLGNFFQTRNMYASFTNCTFMHQQNFVCLQKKKSVGGAIKLGDLYCSTNKQTWNRWNFCCRCDLLFSLMKICPLFPDAVFQCVTRLVKRDIYMEITNVPSLLKLLTGKARIKSGRCLPSKTCTRLVHYTPASLHSDSC